MKAMMFLSTSGLSSSQKHFVSLVRKLRALRHEAFEHLLRPIICTHYLHPNLRIPGRAQPPMQANDYGFWVQRATWFPNGLRYPPTFHRLALRSNSCGQAGSWRIIPCSFRVSPVRKRCPIVPRNGIHVFPTYASSQPLVTGALGHYAEHEHKQNKRTSRNKSPAIQHSCLRWSTHTNNQPRNNTTINRRFWQ